MGVDLEVVAYIPTFELGLRCKPTGWNYSINKVFINGKFAYYMSPSTQNAWEEWSGQKSTFKGEY